MISAVHPGWAVPGSRVLVEGRRLPVPSDGPPQVRVGGQNAHVVSASRDGLRVVVPASAEGGTNAIQIEGEDTSPAPTVEVGRVLATGLHQVDSPAFDGLGRLYVTQSGGQDSKAAVPIYRVTRDGAREPVAVEIANPTSLAHGPDGAMYVSSRFERSVYRLTTDDRLEVFATDLGVPTGLAFARDGSLYVGDRSGSVIRVSRERQVETFATLPPSVAAFHLACGPDDCLYVSAPTLASQDSIYRIRPDGSVETVCGGFGRPQGLAFDSEGRLYVVDALAGAAGLYRVDLASSSAPPALLLTAPALIGLAFDPDGGIALCSNDTVWRIEVGLRPFLPGLA